MFRKYSVISLSVLFVLAAVGTMVFAQDQNRSSARLGSGEMTVDGALIVAPPERNVRLGGRSNLSWGAGTTGTVVTPSGNIISITESSGASTEIQFLGTGGPLQVVGGSIAIVGSIAGATPEVIALVVDGETLTVTVPVGAVADLGLTVDASGEVVFEVVSTSGTLVIQDEAGTAFAVTTGQTLSGDPEGFADVVAAAEAAAEAQAAAEAAAAAASSGETSAPAPSSDSGDSGTGDSSGVGTSGVGGALLP
jgi:hypothetical protein